MGGTRFELVTSSVSGRSAGCPGLPLSARGSTSPGRTLPHGARGCLQDCGEWLPLWLPLWRFGNHAAAQSMPGFRRSVMIRRPSRPPRLDRVGQESLGRRPGGAWLLDSVWRGSLGRMLPRGSPVRFRAGSASSQEHCRSARSGAVGVREQNQPRQRPGKEEVVQQPNTQHRRRLRTTASSCHR